MLLVLPTSNASEICVPVRMDGRRAPSCSSRLPQRDSAPFSTAISSGVRLRPLYRTDCCIILFVFMIDIY